MKWYTQCVPTLLKRYQVTEVPELRAALDVARVVWPEETSTTQLIYRLASVGADQLARDESTSRAARLAKVSSLAGRFPSPLGPDYLEDLRQEWDQ